MNIIHKFFIFIVTIILTSLVGVVLAEPAKNQLLEDINIKISSSEEIKIFLTFSEKDITPLVNVEKISNDLKLSFNDSYVKLDNDIISVNHQLLKEITIVNINNKLNLIFKSPKESSFTIKQNNNIYALTIIPKQKVNNDNNNNIALAPKKEPIVAPVAPVTPAAKNAVEKKSDNITNINSSIQTPKNNTEKIAQLNQNNIQKADFANKPIKFSDKVSDNNYQIVDFDFRLTEDKAAKIILTFSNNKIAIIPDETGNDNNVLKFNFREAVIKDNLNKKYDVLDFGTVVNSLNFTVDSKSKDLIMNINSKSSVDYLVYQKQNNLIIEVRDKSDNKTKNTVFSKEYSGRKISLNFQNIDLRTVLQIIADFTELNLVASDTVQGSISLRLMNVPWDQALDIILKTKNLDKRQFGNILMIAPTNEIFELEKAELESEKMVEGLIKLETEYYPINYAEAENIAQLISGKNKILSARGNASFDKRTNLLIIQDTPSKLKEIREILKKLDSPVKQVLIEARLVRASSNFRKELGIRWGLSAKRSSNNYRIGVGDTSPNATKVLTDGTVVSPKTQQETQDVAGDTGFNIDLGLNDPSTVLGLALAKLPGKTLVHLELSALESEGLLQTISSPKLITANKVPARIEQGQEIPYQESTSSGATNIAFKKAVLSLIVTPQITPDSKIIMNLNVTNDTADFSQQLSQGVPVVNTQEVETQVLIDDGQTIVLGGIFTQTTNNSVEKVPFFGDLPVVGQLFRKNVTRDDRDEFLIFITPKVVVDKS